MVQIELMLLATDKIWETLRSAAEEDRVVLAAALFIILALVLAPLLPHERRRIKNAAWLFAFSIILFLASGLLQSAELVSEKNAFRWASLLIGGIALVNLISAFLFEVAIRALRLDPPRILRDLAVATGYLGLIIWLLAKSEVSLSGIITTSAVLTAIIGLAFQDTLGNVFAGLALQLEKSISVGDWVRIDQAIGQVKEIRWRHTVIETRNWDTIIIPNSMLMKNQILIYGKCSNQPLQHRQWVYFNVDFRISPTEVIQAVNAAIQAEPIPGVAAEPKPHCILYDFKESYCTYAVRYWLTDLPADDPTDSLIRTRIYFALKRADIPLSIPAQSVFLTQESEQRKQLKREREMQRRIQALAGVELFQRLNQGEIETLAERLRPAPFTRGEAMTRQGAEAHWLYILVKGSAEVRITGEDGVSKRVATLKAGDFFGEMSLMTGEPRAATVIALEDSECYRLDKHDFHDIIYNRPEIAEHISHVLARRRVELEAAREELDAESRSRRINNVQRDLLARISKFFGLSSRVLTR
jgi:small-conductance mechanosensitive channel/CRP-like cAMP-binding protein